MCECTPNANGRYCGQPGCRDPLAIEVDQLRATPHRDRISTEDLSLLQYSQYIDRVIDLAVTELGVTFDFVAAEREAVRHERKRRTKLVAQEVAA